MDLHHQESRVQCAEYSRQLWRPTENSQVGIYGCSKINGEEHEFLDQSRTSEVSLIILPFLGACHFRRHDPNPNRVSIGHSYTISYWDLKNLWFNTPVADIVALSRSQTAVGEAHVVNQEAWSLSNAPCL